MTDPGEVTVSLVLTLAVMLSVGRPVVPVRPEPPVVQPPPLPPKPFQDRWGDTVAAARIIPLVRVVKVERIEPELPQPPPEAPPVIEDAPELIPQPPIRTRKTHTRAASLDICQRHRMRKVTVGRSWRCRR